MGGKCNEADTDCECSDRTVSAKQYALCLSPGICRAYCQKKGFASGKCAGDTKWDCKCVSKSDG